MRRARLRLVGFTLLAFASASAGAARAELPAVQVTQNDTADAEPAAWGRRIAWTGADPIGGDREVFWLDTAQPAGAGPPPPCPLANPCRLSSNEADDARPRVTGYGVFWESTDLPWPRGTLHFSDGEAAVAIPGSVARYESSWHASGPRVLWFGADTDERSGLFLFDVRSAADAGTPVACPGSNPCVVALGAAAALDEGSQLHLSGDRAVWSAAPEGAGTDPEVLLFDATRPAELTAPAACPLGNPCLVTNNAVADVSPVVSAERIAWLRCPDADCGSSLPTAFVIASDAGTLEVPWEDAYGALQLGGPWLVFGSGYGASQVFDTRKDVLVEGGWACPGANPCFLPGSTPHVLVGSQLLMGTGYDVAGPFELRVVDLARPLAPGPIASCTEGGNPCVARDEAQIGGYAYSGPLIAWSECAGDFGCFDDDTTEIYYALPEPAGAAAALLALAGLVRAGRPRSPLS